MKKAGFVTRLQTFLNLCKPVDLHVYINYRGGTVSESHGGTTAAQPAVG